MIGVGFALQPDEEFLELTAPLLGEIDFVELAPETLWRSSGLSPNGFHRRFAGLKAEGRHVFIAHGVAFSVGSATDDRERKDRWLEAIRRDQQIFDFAWYTDHLGVTAIDGEALTLPLPLPPSEASANVVRESLQALRSAVPVVGVENNVAYFALGDPLDEPELIRASLGEDGWLLLDLHNVFTTATNFQLDAREYLRRLPLERVIEIHVSGGAESDPAWLPSGATRRLDSHDAAVPDDVWRLLEETLPRCPAVRCVTLERMEGSVAPSDVALLRAELRRIRATVERA